MVWLLGEPISSNVEVPRRRDAAVMWRAEELEGATMERGTF